MSLNPNEKQINDTFNKITSSSSLSSLNDSFNNFIYTYIKDTQNFIYILRLLSSYIKANPSNGFNLLSNVITLLSNESYLIHYFYQLLNILQDNMNNNYTSHIINAFNIIIMNLKGNFTLEIYELLNGFCIHNMISFPQIVIECYRILITTSLDDSNNFVEKEKVVHNVYENIMNYLDMDEFMYKAEMLDVLKMVISFVKEGLNEYAGMILYKVLDFLVVDSIEIKIISLEIIKMLTEYCYNAIVHLKEQIVNFLNVTQANTNEEQAKLCNEIYSLFMKGEGDEKKRNEDKIEEVSQLPLKISELSVVNKEDNDKEIKVNHKSKNGNNEHKNVLNKKHKGNVNNNKQKYNNNNNVYESINDNSNNNKYDIVSSPIGNIDNVEGKYSINSNDVPSPEINQLKSQYENKISSLLSQMKIMSEKQLQLIDIITTLQENSSSQITTLTSRIAQLESTIETLNQNISSQQPSSPSIALPLSTKPQFPPQTPNELLSVSLQSPNESAIINTITSFTIPQLKELSSETLNDTFLRITTFLTKGSFLSESISFLKTILISNPNAKSLNPITIRNLKDVLTYLITETHNFTINDNNKIDMSLLLSFINKQ